MVMVVVGSLATCRGVSWVSREELLSVLYRQKLFEVRYLDEQKFNEIIDKLYNARNEIMDMFLIKPVHTYRLLYYKNLNRLTHVQQRRFMQNLFLSKCHVRTSYSTPTAKQ